MSAQYTPPPWEIAKGYIPGFNGLHVGIVKASHAVGSTDEAICVIAPMVHMTVADDTNALLLHAAPEMYEALKMTDLGLHEGDYRGPCLCSQCSFRKAAAIAIAKAEGREG